MLKFRCILEFLCWSFIDMGIFFDNIPWGNVYFIAKYHCGDITIFYSITRCDVASFVWNKSFQQKRMVEFQTCIHSVNIGYVKNIFFYVITFTSSQEFYVFSIFPIFFSFVVITKVVAMAVMMMRMMMVFILMMVITVSSMMMM